MQNGIVKSWDKAKGFGFISNKDDEDFFVHSSDLDISVKEKILRPGQKVAFDIRSDYRGDRAVHVRILNPK